MNEQRAPGIGAIAAKYGLIAGVLLFAAFLAMFLTRIQSGWVATAVTAVLLIVLMVLAHREFKRTQGGMMTYGQGLGSGTLLAAVAALVRCVLLYVYVQFINTGYFAVAVRAEQAALEQRGITGEHARHAMAFTASILTPVGLVVVSLITGVIGGFIVALIVSAFTQNSESASYGARPPG